MKAILAALALCFLFATPNASAQDSGGGAQFDYYLLSLSWAPTYCESHPRDHSSECTAGEHTGFVLHGLWPQSNSGPELQACSSASPVSKAIVTQMLQYMPSRGLVQHEWATHGTCSGLSSADYFHKVVAAYKSVQIPDSFKSPNQAQKVSLKDLEAAFAAANQASAEAFRVSCHGRELVNLEVCMDKNLHFQACGASVRECPSSSVQLPAPK